MGWASKKGAAQNCLKTIVGRAEHGGNEFMNLARKEVGACRRGERKKRVIPVRAFGS